MSKRKTLVKEELIRLTAKLSGISQEKTEKVLDGLCEAIYQSISTGQAISLVGVGKIEPKYVPAKEEREKYFYVTQETLHKEAEPACYRVQFKPSQVLLARLKADSYERDVDDYEASNAE